jgi:ParB family chromosome partitioning protein
MTKSRLNLAQVRTYGAGLHKAETQTAAVIASTSVKDMSLPVSQILDRPSGDSRPLSIVHVVDLAESISALGLIEPVSVDKRNRLLAGGHRLAALRILEQPPQQRRQGIARHVLHLSHSEIAADTWVNKAVDEQMERLLSLPVWKDPIPAHVMDVDAVQEAELAFAIEMAENDKRRDYSPQDIKHLAEKLRSSGYTFTKGRPRENEKKALPLLQAIVGKSMRTLQRLMEEDATAPSTSKVSPTELAFQSSKKLKGTLSKFNGQVEALDISDEQKSALSQWLAQGLELLGSLDSKRV